MNNKHHHPTPDDTRDREILRKVDETIALDKQILKELRHDNRFPTHITFQELTMNPTAAGQSQVFTGTLTPAGATYPSDTVFSVTSNDPAVSPSVDASGLVVSVTYPQGWVESTSTPLAFAYTASSASGSLSATITPSAPVSAFPTGINFSQTT